MMASLQIFEMRWTLPDDDPHYIDEDEDDSDDTDDGDQCHYNWE